MLYSIRLKNLSHRRIWGVKISTYHRNRVGEHFIFCSVLKSFANIEAVVDNVKRLFIGHEDIATRYMVSKRCFYFKAERAIPLYANHGITEKDLERFERSNKCLNLSCWIQLICMLLQVTMGIPLLAFVHGFLLLANLYSRFR